MFQLRRTIALLKMPDNDPEFTLSQNHAVDGLLPLPYVILLLNTLTLAAMHVRGSPSLTSIVFPALIAIIVASRILALRTTANRDVTAEDALYASRHTNRLVVLICTTLVLWATLQSWDGDESAKAQLAASITLALGACIVLVMSAGRTDRDFVLLSKLREELILSRIEIRRLCDENVRLANSDAITGLANRQWFFSELERAIDEALQSDGLLAIGRIDLDGLKSVNDGFGHTAGDLVLHEVGLRLGLLATGSISFARLGVDQFGVVFRGEAVCSMVEIANAVRVSLAEPFVTPSTVVEIRASIGVAELPDAGCTAAQLFERAGDALCLAKQAECGMPAVFSPGHQDAPQDAGLIDRVLRHADFQAEMYLVFQPIVDVERGRTVAFECLARWNSPELGLVEPTVFIRAAERCNLINRLTEVLLRKALASAKAWPVTIQISFNLSVCDIGSEEAVHRVAEIIRQSGIAPHRIEFEITETAVMRDFEQARQSLSYLRALGSRIALDDFGTGYSSLCCVHRLPLDKIKVDRGFTVDVEQESAGRTIVTTVLDLCRILKLDCVVEGLETASQVRIIKSLGCSLMQGYVFGRPMQQEDIAACLAREQRLEQQAACNQLGQADLPIAARGLPASTSSRSAVSLEAAML